MAKDDQFSGVAAMLPTLTVVQLLCWADVGAELPTGPGGIRAAYSEILQGMRETPLQRVVATRTPAIATLGQLRAQQIQWRQAIASMQVEFTFTQYEAGGADRSVAELLETTPAQICRIVYAEKGVKKYRSLVELDGSTRRVGPSHNEMLYKFNAARMMKYSRGGKTGELQDLETAEITDMANLYFEAISVPLGLDAERQKQTWWYIPTALSDADTYRVAPFLEEVDGAPCHVVTSGPDTFWIDFDQGGAVRRRAAFRQMRHDDPGVIWYVQMNKEYVSPVDAVWLPEQTFRLDYTTQDQPPSRRGRLTAVYATKAAISLNDVDDSLFEFEFPPGTLVFDNDKGVQFFSKGGEESLDDAIANAKAIPGIAPAQSAVPSSRRLLAATIWLLNSAVALAILLALWRRSRSKSRDNGGAS